MASPLLAKSAGLGVAVFGLLASISTPPSCPARSTSIGSNGRRLLVATSFSAASANGSSPLRPVASTFGRRAVEPHSGAGASQALPPGPGLSPGSLHWSGSAAVREWLAAIVPAGPSWLLRPYVPGVASGAARCSSGWETSALGLFPRATRDATPPPPGSRAPQFAAITVKIIR